MSKRILVVEDQEDSRRILRDLLKSADYELLKSDEFSSVFLRRLRFEDGRRPIAL